MTNHLKFMILAGLACAVVSGFGFDAFAHEQGRQSSAPPAWMQPAPALNPPGTGEKLRQHWFNEWMAYRDHRFLERSALRKHTWQEWWDFWSRGKNDWSKLHSRWNDERRDLRQQDGVKRDQWKTLIDRQRGEAKQFHLERREGNKQLRDDLRTEREAYRQHRQQEWKQLRQHQAQERRPRTNR